jgi:cell division transport system permease protein
VLDRLSFLLQEAFVALRRNTLMTFAAVTTVAVSLFLLGGVGLVYLRVMEYSESLPPKMEMRVVVKDGTNYEGIRQIAERLREIEGVATASWIPRDKAWERWKAEHPDAHVEGIPNPLPDAFKVVLSDLNYTDAAATEMRRLPSVESVVYAQEVQNFIAQALSVLRWLGFVVGGLLLATGGVLIYNAIRLTVLSRRLEIRIMQLVGASRSTIKIPFYIEGVVQGSLGGALASLLLMGGYEVLQGRLSSLSAFGKLPPFPMILVLSMMVALGAAYGLVCSVFAVRTPLKFR